ncbi:MAG: dihydroorotase [Candidatus Poribacteria bacterium]
MKILIRNGELIDPANKINRERLDLLVIDGKIADINENISVKDADIINADGLIVVPGLIDMHVHLREPGQEYKETIKTGTKSALKGGFTSIMTMANTNPVIDSVQVLKDLLARINDQAVVNIFPASSITIRMQGEMLVDVDDLVVNGVVALSDDGKPVMNSQIMKNALIACKRHNIPIISHCEWIDKEYDGWVMNKGEMSKKLGIIGIPNSAEEKMVERDINLAEETDSHIHIAHVSTAGTVELIRQAKKRGVKVTAEATPHHFTLTDETVEKYGANAKMNPPLRSKDDVSAVIEGLKDHTIDVIATDHAPHAEYEKAKGLKDAPFGIVGLETCLSLVITELVNKGHLSLYEAIEKMTINPAKILNLKKGTLSVGADADITIIDINKEWTVDPSKFESKGRNTPFIDWKLKGSPAMIVGGNGKIYRISN